MKSNKIGSSTKSNKREPSTRSRGLLAPQATAAHSGQIIPNLLVCLQDEKRWICMITMQEQQAEKSKLPEVVPPPNYTTQSSTKVIKGHMRD